MLECIERGTECFEKVCEIVNWAKRTGSGVLSVNRGENISADSKAKKEYFVRWKNYREHAVEMGGVESIPENIMIFTKAPTTVIGINEQINGHPHATDELDYEGELAIIIGKRGK